MSLSTPENVQKLQAALHAKAKGSPDFRFYSLYDKIYREDLLDHAWRICKANGGAAGVDGKTFRRIEKDGRLKWLGELAEELRRKAYRPEAVRRVWIPKADGKKRPLGIPTIRDRVVQTAAMLVLEPIFEADLMEEQYAYRRGRNGLMAVQRLHSLLCTGHLEVVDADLKGYFDAIPHASLMKSVARRVVDRRMLSLVKSWLEAPVEEKDERGRKSRTTRNKDAGRGTPQGAPISPLLSNLYMRRFLAAWKKFGLEKRLDAHIVNYADDFVICCRGTAEEAMQSMRKIMERLDLTVNESKTRICRVPEERVEFLGYSVGRWYSSKDGRPFIGTRPSRESLKRIRKAISEETGTNREHLDVDVVVKGLNRRLRGWYNYFRLDAVPRSYQQIDGHARHRLRQWLRRKHKKARWGDRRYSLSYLYEELGVYRLQFQQRDFSCAKA